MKRTIYLNVEPQGNNYYAITDMKWKVNQLNDLNVINNNLSKWQEAYQLQATLDLDGRKSDYTRWDIEQALNHEGIIKVDNQAELNNSLLPSNFRIDSLAKNLPVKICRQQVQASREWAQPLANRLSKFPAFRGLSTNDKMTVFKDFLNEYPYGETPFEVAFTKAMAKYNQIEPQAISNGELERLTNDIKKGKTVPARTYISHDLKSDQYKVLDNRKGDGKVLKVNSFDEAHQLATEPFSRNQLIYADRDNMFNIVTFDRIYQGFNKGDQAIEQVGESGMPGTCHYLMPATKEIARFISDLDDYADNHELQAALAKAAQDWPEHSQQQNIQLDDLTRDQLNAIRDNYDHLPRIMNDNEKKITTKDLVKQAHKTFLNGTKDVDSLQHFVNRSAQLMRYSDSRYHNGGNRMLLIDDPRQDRYYLSKTELENGGIHDIDYGKLKGRHVFAIKPQADQKIVKGQPVKFSTGKLYSLSELNQHYPELAEQTRRIALSHMPYNERPGKEVYQALTEACSKNYVMYPSRRKDPLVAAQARVAKHMAFGKAGFRKYNMEFANRERAALSKLDRKALGQFYQKAANRAWVIDYDMQKALSKGHNLTKEMANSQRPKEKMKQDSRKQPESFQKNTPKVQLSSNLLKSREK